MRARLLIIMAVFVTVLPWTAPSIVAQGGIVIDAVDNDPDNKLWNCETNRVPFGNEEVDRSRCFSFRYQVPPEGINSATLHVSINTLGAMQETDSTVVAVGEYFSDCAWATGGMAGCIGLHGGFEGPHRSLNLNLLDIACDPSVQGSPEKQQALIEQLQTGVLHFLLQDDTAVYGAKLVLNGGPPTVACGTSEQPVSEVLPGGGQPSGGGSSPGSMGASSVPGDDLPPPPFGSPEPASVSRMTLQAGQRQVVEGQLVNVPVWLINGEDVANINFTIGYDAGVAMPEGDSIKGNLLDNALFSANTSDTGLIRAGFAQTSGLNGTGTVAYIPFRAVGKPGDRTALDVAVSTINDPDGTVLTIDRIDGQILIVGSDGVVPGDCDGDGALTEVDALCALQMSVQLIPERLVLDLDTDSQVTSRDSVIILQRAIGK